MARQITRIGHAESPKWSPDGTRILFIRRTKAAGPQRELWVMAADGSGLRRLGTARDVVAADWSPDGASIAMVRAGEVPRRLQLWITSADGSNARSIGGWIDGTEARLAW